MTTLNNDYDQIIIMIMIMNVEYIWQIKVSSAVAYDFNHLIYAVCAPQI